MPCCRNEGKTGKERNLVIFKIFLRITVSIESSRRDLFIDMVVDRFSNVTQLRSPPDLPSYPQQVCVYLKQGLVFTVIVSLPGKSTKISCVHSNMNVWLLFINNQHSSSVSGKGTIFTTESSTPCL